MRAEGGIERTPLKNDNLVKDSSFRLTLFPCRCRAQFSLKRVGFLKSNQQASAIKYLDRLESDMVGNIFIADFLNLERSINLEILLGKHN